MVMTGHNFGARATRLWLAGLLALTAVVASMSAVAAERLPVRLLTTVAGAPEEPGNLKVALTLPQSQRELVADQKNLRFYIYPKNLTPQQGAVPRYRAEGVLFWQREDLVFADLRLLPKQDFGGDYTLLAAVVRDGVVACAGLADRAVSYQAGEADVVLVIDSSQSMSRNDPKRKRVDAASAFIEMAARDGRIGAAGLVRFNDTAQTLCALTTLTAKDQLLAALRQIRSEGQTNIGLALETALEQFAPESRHRNAVVLLTDGKNESVPYADQHRLFGAREIPVYCIGLSDAADMALLERIANETGGKAFRAADDQGLMAIYLRIAAELGRRQVIISKTLGPGEESVSVPVDPAVRDVSFCLDAGKERAALSLLPPARGGMSPLQYAREGYQELRVAAPQNGMWQVRVRRAPGAGNEPLTLTVSADTGLFLDVFPLVVSGRELLVGATLAVGGRPVTGSRVNLMPDSGLSAMQLYDDGQHQDGASGDGVYAGVVAQPAGNGIHKARLLLRAWGQDPGAHDMDFLRQADAGEAVLPGRNVGVPAPANAAVTVRAPKAAQTTEKTVQPVAPKIQTPPVVAKPAEKLVVSSFDFGRAAPGQRVEAEFTLTYTGQGGALAISCSDMRTAPVDLSDAEQALDRNDSGAISMPQMELIQKQSPLTNGDRKLRVGLTLPENTQNGVYTGQVRICAGTAQTTAIARVEVIRPELQLGQERLNLGCLLPGESVLVRLPVAYSGPEAMRANLLCDEGWVTVEPAEFIVQPGEKSDIALTFTLSARTAPGASRGQLALRAAGVNKTIALEALVTGRGLVTKSRLPGHELALLPAGVRRAETLPGHELSLRQPTRPYDHVPVVKAPDPVPVVAGHATQVLSADASAKRDLASIAFSDWGRVILLVVAGVALAVFLIFLRRLLTNRMARFAMLSTALHLPLLAFIAGYIMIVSQSQPQPKPQEFSADLVSVSESVSATQRREENPSRDAEAAAEERVQKKLVAGAQKQTGNEVRFRPDAMQNTKSAALAPVQLKREVAAKTSVETMPTALATRSLQRRTLSEIDRPIARKVDLASRQPTVPTGRTVEQTVAQPAAPQMDLTAAQEMTPSKENARDVPTAAGLEKAPVFTGKFSPQQMGNGTQALAQHMRGGKPVVASDRERAIAANIALQDSGESAQRRADISVLSQVDAASAVLQRTPDTRSQSLESITESRTAPQRNPVAVLETAMPASIAAVQSEDRGRTVEQGIKIMAASVALPASLGDGMGGGKPVLARQGKLNEPLPPMRVSALEQVQGAALQVATPAREQRLENPVREERVPEVPLMEVATSDNGNTSGRALDDTRSVLDEVRSPERLVARLPQQTHWETSMTRTIAQAKNDTLPVSSVADTVRHAIAPAATLGVTAESALHEIGRTEVSLVSVAPRAPEFNPVTAPDLAPSPVATPAVEQADAGALVGERERFIGSGGSRAVHMAPEMSGAGLVRGDTASVKLSRKAVPLTGAADSAVRMELARPATSADMPQSAQADSTGFSLVVGVVGEPGLFRAQPGALPVQEVPLQLTAASLSNCQLAVIRGDKELAPAEIAALRGYLQQGGKIWFCDGAIPAGLAYDGPITNLAESHPIFTATHDLRGRLAGVQAVDNGALAVLSAQAKRVGDFADLADNVLQTLLGGGQGAIPEEISATPLAGIDVPWQDFSTTRGDQQGWSVEKWGDPARIGLAPDGDNGEALLVALMRGTEGKTAVSYSAPDSAGRRINLDGCRAIRVDVYNPSKEPVSLTVLFTTFTNERGWDQFEARATKLRPGWNRSVDFPMVNLRARSGGGSEFNSALEGADQCARVTLLLRTVEGGDFLFDNLRWVK